MSSGAMLDAAKSTEWVVSGESIDAGRFSRMKFPNIASSTEYTLLAGSATTVSTEGQCENASGSTVVALGATRTAPTRPSGTTQWIRVVFPLFRAVHVFVLVIDYLVILGVLRSFGTKLAPLLLTRFFASVLRIVPF